MSRKKSKLKGGDFAKLMLTNESIVEQVSKEDPKLLQKMPLLNDAVKKFKDGKTSSSKSKKHSSKKKHKYHYPCNLYS